MQGALSAYEAALAIAPGHEDALYNRALVEKLLRQMHNQRQSERGRGSPDQGEQQDSQAKQAPAEDGTPPGSEQQDTDQPPEQSDAERDDGRVAEQAADGASDDIGEPQSRNHDGTNSNDEKVRDGEPEDAGSAPEDVPAIGTEEAHQALQQWLRQIPDDPGGLLRRKILLEHRRRHAQTQHGEQPW